MIPCLSSETLFIIQLTCVMPLLNPLSNFTIHCIENGPFSDTTWSPDTTWSSDKTWSSLTINPIQWQKI